MWINRVFNLRPGDFGRGLPMFGYYFLIISSYIMGQVARDALFLDQFKAVQLPYADIATAGLVGIIVAFYIRLGRLFGLRNLLVSSLLFYTTNVMALWLAMHYYKWVWLSPFLYVWVGIFGVLATAQVWTLANFVWTTREAKRLFGSRKRRYRRRHLCRLLFKMDGLHIWHGESAARCKFVFAFVGAVDRPHLA